MFTAEAEGLRALGGVLHTGDPAVSNDPGFLKILGRTREGEAARRRGGFLRELEDAFYDQSDVLHATVVEDLKGAVHSFVELLPGATATAEELASAATAMVAPGLAPITTTVLDVMPRTFSGKADRLTLFSRAGA